MAAWEKPFLAVTLPSPANLAGQSFQPNRVVCSLSLRSVRRLPNEFWEAPMSQGQAADFGRLYRAAFAERDPDKKLTLLREVQQVLHSWHQSVDSVPTTDISLNRPAFPLRASTL